MAGPTIGIEDPDRPDVLAMIEAADAFYAELYPGERNYLLSAATLAAPGVAFYVARLEGPACGFGAVVEQGADWAEIKRMYVDPEARGHGVGRLILEALEGHAQRLGLRCLRLETGVKQAAALGLYRSSGYRETGRFGAYRADPLSVFMEKWL